MRSKYHRIHYRAMPVQSRFGMIFGVLHNEECYTAEELQFRTRVLAARVNSGLDADLLQTSSNWFSTNQDSAFANINENSWLFNPEYLPREPLSTEDFHISLVDNQRLNWPELATMTRTIGDYLLLRNSNLPTSHLNQPMNYVLLDMVRMLKRLSMVDNAEYVTQQLQLLHNYLRVVEIHTSATIGSDRLFLSDCRRTIEHQQQTIENQIHSRQLKTQIHQVQQQLNQVAELRHTILHFALSDSAVNPHPYWEHFATLTPSQPDSKKEFPTLAAKACGTMRSDALTTLSEKPANQQLNVLELSAATLSHCQDFNFVTDLPEAVKDAYRNSLIDLQEILRFQGILDQLQQLFDKAGEVFTIIQFREEMLGLLKNIEQFIQHSQQNIMQVLEANTNLYHQFIQAKQDLRWWEKMLTQRQEKIDTFIENQDNLARFDTTPTSLQMANKELLQHVNQVVNQLMQHASETNQLELVSTTRNMVEQLMDSMHAWIGRQYELKGLPIPEKPKFNTLSEKNQLETSKPVKKHYAHPHPSIIKEPPPLTSSTSKLSPFQFWSPPQVTYLPATQACHSHSCNSIPPMLSSTENNPGNSANPTASMMYAGAALGFLVLLPVSILALKLLYDSWQVSSATENNDVSDFEAIKIKTEDLLSLVNNLQEEIRMSDLDYSLPFINEEYHHLINKAGKGQFDVSEMQSLHDELVEIQLELSNSISQNLNSPSPI
ncbi:hypothetical protein [Legionella jamestowniensis]|uniref:Uncharacterized protein n=1 Tax=Legionella jamestowniensis TaxID=455 RepID=A0A0W0UIJ9_9GAMM|nr:hypothetical protein [Legionella jamestowniensis]KTD07669.1 hypothetical protein Ljam_1864 [Legionella jamestowniensis]SFL60388.1 hypothetical protein SAMN02746073_0983 [Legionella jamestowniensis DSM 19215]